EFYDELAPGKNLPPGRPVVALPTLVHTGVIVVRDVDVHEVDARALAHRREANDQRRIRIVLLERARAPGLDDQASGNGLQYPSAKRAAECPEIRSRPGTDGHLASGDGAVPLRADVGRVQLLCGRGKDHRLLDDLGHDVVVLGLSGQKPLEA